MPGRDPVATAPGTDLESYKRLPAYRPQKPRHETGRGALPFTIYHLRFTVLVIGFDRSAFAAGPDLSGLGNQNVNLVTLRSMTKVFRSILSKIRSSTDFLKSIEAVP